MTSYRYPTLGLSAVAVALALIAGLDFAASQVVLAPGLADNGEQNLPLLPTDRTLSRGIRKAQERIEGGEYSQAIRFLDDVLRPEQEDYFVDLGASGEHVGLKETARRMIKGLPDEGRALYQATYGPVARRELEKARATGSEEAIRTIAFRYFHTEAGNEAALILAQSQTDVGRDLSAALIYQELLGDAPVTDNLQPQLSLLAASAWRSAGEEDKAAALLRDLSKRGYRSVQVAGRDMSIEQLADAPLPWLQRNLGDLTEGVSRPRSEWLTARGNTLRNAHVKGGLPHMRERWAVRLLDHPILEDHHDTIVADKLRENSPLAVAGAPLAVGDYVITRSAHNLLAVDFRTGKRVWRSQPQRVKAFEDLSSDQTLLAEPTRESPLRKLNERVWKDYLYNSISSDGDRVYVIRDLSAAQNFDVDIFGGAPMMGEPGLNPGNTNRLCAYELASEGKLVWEVDGASDSSELSGAFFLGAPLWVGQSLFGLVEIKSAVHLVALDRRTGQLQWKQQLVGLEANVLVDRSRRLFAAVPSYDSGMLVCTTGAGVVVGVDLAKQSLAWAYRYENQPSQVINLRGRRRVATGTESEWTDPATIIADGKVLITPPDSDQLHCLELISGKLLWKIDRDDFLWVAGVDRGRILLVGNDKLKAISLADGTTAWPHSEILLDSGSAPSGRGFFADGMYYIPLASAEVLAIDVQEGRVVARSVSRDGRVLGNLVCYRGAVISQTGSYLDCYDLVDIIRANSENALLSNKNDADALRVLGEIAYNEGDMGLAIDYLQRSLASEGENLRTKEVLIECLEVALEEDFVAHQDQLALLRELHESTGSNQENLLRIEAQGLFKTGDRLGAAAACLQLYAELSQNDQLLEVRRDYHTNMSRWLRCQMGLIWSESSEQERLSIAESLSTLLQKAQANVGNLELDRFADCFGSLEVSEPALLQIAEDQLALGEVLTAQQIYLTLVDSTDLSTQAKATARCSQMLHERGLAQLALSFDEKLAGPLANEICLDEMTGLECLATWADGEDSSEVEWPYGRVNVTSVATKSKRNARGQFPQTRLRFERTDDVLGRTTVLATTRTRGQIEVLDGLGNQFFAASNNDQQRVRIYSNNSNYYYAVSRGNLLLVSHGMEIAAYNTLATSGDDDDKLLWGINVAQGLNYENRIVYRDAGRDQRRVAPSKPTRAMQDQRWIGVLGPLCRDSFVYQDQRRLVCIDPISEEIKWWRSDVPLGCDLYGDEQYLFVVPRNSKEAFVFSTMDGRSFGQVPVPSWDQQLATVGRNFIRWEKLASGGQGHVAGEQRLSALDSLNGEVLWEYTFQRGARVDITQGRYIAVVETDGDCTIIDAADGAMLAEGTFSRSAVLRDIDILAGADSFVVVREQPFTVSQERKVQSLNTLDYRVMDGSLLAFDRATGAPMWSKPVEVHQEAFILSQPVDLPVLGFAGTIINRTSRGGHAETSMVLLEKSSGRLIFQDDKLPQAVGNYCRLKAPDPEHSLVEVEMANRTIRVEFTDQPRPPEPPATIGGDSQRKKQSSGLLGIGLKLMGQEGR